MINVEVKKLLACNQVNTMHTHTRSCPPQGQLPLKNFMIIISHFVSSAADQNKYINLLGGDAKVNENLPENFEFFNVKTANFAAFSRSISLVYTKYIKLLPLNIDLVCAYYEY